MSNPKRTAINAANIKAQNDDRAELIALRARMTTPIRIEDEAGRVAIMVNNKRYSIDQEESHELLKQVFTDLGFTNVEYEEVY
jgi:hypothetical protein